MNLPRVLLLGGTFALLASTACSLLLTADDQCRTDDDCARRGGDLAGRSCVNAVCRPRETPVVDAGVDAPSGSDSGGPFGCAELAKPNGDPSKPATVEQPVFNVVTTTPLAGAPGRVCSRVDPNCTSPVASITSDEKGVYSVKVFVGFEGFLEVRGTAVADTILMLDPPIRGDSRRPTAPFPTKDISEFYSQQITGAPLDTTTGYVLARAVDCDFKPLLGVTARLAATSAKTKLFFVYNNTPRADVDRTNEEGAFGFFNVPVGTALITVSDATTGQKIGQTSVVVRAGFLTILYLGPSK